MKKGFLIILLLLASCGQPQQNTALVVQYNDHVILEQQIVADHNKILENLRFTMGDKFSYRKSIDDYLQFADQYKKDLLAFKEFLVKNEQVLAAQGIDAAGLRRDLQNMIDTVDRNAKEFREWKVNNPVTT